MPFASLPSRSSRLIPFWFGVQCSPTALWADGPCCLHRVDGVGCHMRMLCKVCLDHNGEPCTRKRLQTLHAWTAPSSVLLLLPLQTGFECQPKAGRQPLYNHPQPHPHPHTNPYPCPRPRATAPRTPRHIQQRTPAFPLLPMGPSPLAPQSLCREAGSSGRTAGCLPLPTVPTSPRPLPIPLPLSQSGQKLR